MKRVAVGKHIADSLLIVTGSMGAGKNAVMAEASDILSARGIPHAAIDMDALAVAHTLDAGDNDEMMYRNLQCVAANCAAVGLRRVLLARAIESRALLDHICRIFPATKTTVCRVDAKLETMKQRVALRETGLLQRELVARVAELNAILDRAALEDFVVANENRSVTEVALEMLLKAGWISA